MDRSFLSDKAVIEASRDFVCIRLATYEDADEAKILKNLFSGPSDNLENTVYAMLGPDGKTRLTRTGRSPGFAFGGHPEIAAANMAAEMKKIAKKHKVTGKPINPEEFGMPYLADVRLAVNVSACDNLPLVIVSAPDEATKKSLEKKLLPLVWHADYRGQFTVVSAKSGEDLEIIKGASAKPGITIVQPDEYGQSAKSLLFVSAESDRKAFQDSLDKALGKFNSKEKDWGEHVSKGNRTGVHWETAIPVTDSHARGGREGNARPPGRGAGSRRPGRFRPPPGGPPPGGRGPGARRGERPGGPGFGPPRPHPRPEGATPRPSEKVKRQEDQERRRPPVDDQ